MRWCFLAGMFGGLTDIASTSGGGPGRLLAAVFVVGSCLCCLVNEMLSDPDG